jgi:predicted amidohydrolase YtcJ
MKKCAGCLFITLIIIFNACSPMENADMIIKNAKIYTVNTEFDLAGAMAVHKGKIIAVGSESEILDRFESKNVIDLDGKAVYPGFIDAHCHFYGYGLGLLQRADLTSTNSFDEIIEIVKKHHENYASFWIEGRGWDQNDWEIKAFPDKEKLDKLFPDNPVLLTRIDGHAAIANSKALEISGIDKNTRIEGGTIMLKNGEPTGVLIDNAIELVSNKIPEPDDLQISKALLVAQKNCFEVGLTGVHDAGLETRVVKIIDSLQQSGQLKMKIYAMLSPTEENFLQFVSKGIYKTHALSVRSIKLYADGALGSRGAKMIEDYSDDPGNSGLVLTTPDLIRKSCEKAIENNYQVCTHAIGDSANRMMLQIYGEFLKGKNDKRWRIEHDQIIAPGDFEYFNTYSIVPSVQPTHATSDMYWATDRVGAERMKGAYAYKQLLDQNGWIPLGTDFPIENISPLYTFYAAVERKDLKGFPEGGFQTENALTREEALKGITIWAAKAGFEENEKGSLEPGKAADFVILDKDIMQIPGSDLPDAKVLRLFVDGKEVFGRY